MKTRRKRPEAKTPGMFVIPAGTPCQVRRGAADPWQPHRTRVALVARSLHRVGSSVIIRHGDWQVRVHADAVSRLFANPA